MYLITLVIAISYMTFNVTNLPGECGLYIKLLSILNFDFQTTLLFFIIINYSNSQKAQGTKF